MGKLQKKPLYFSKPQCHKDRLYELLSLLKLLAEEETSKQHTVPQQFDCRNHCNYTKYFKSCQYKQDLEMENTMLVITSVD